MCPYRSVIISAWACPESPLHDLDVPAGQDQFISYTAVTQTVECHAREPQRKQLFFQHPRESFFL